MKGVGMLMVPAKMPYELQVLLEHVDWYARRYGRVRLRLNQHEWLVSAGDGDQARACGVCRDERPGLAFVKDARLAMCGRCARQDVCANTRRWSWRRDAARVGAVVA